jgi:hypothetical protein
MAAARRLSELLQEQQEPFLVETARARRPRRGRGAVGAGVAGGGLGCCPAAACRRLFRLCNQGFKKRRAAAAAGGGSGSGVASGLRLALSKVLCGRGMRRVLRLDDLCGGGGCFSGASACGAREFRRLRRSLGDSGECDPRAMVLPGDDGEEEQMGWKADMDVDSSRQLSPVSVLELHSDDDDDESPVHSHCKLPLTHASTAILINSVSTSHLVSYYKIVVYHSVVLYLLILQASYHFKILSVFFTLLSKCSSSNGRS